MTGKVTRLMRLNGSLRGHGTKQATADVESQDSRRAAPSSLTCERELHTLATLIPAKREHVSDSRLERANVLPGNDQVVDVQGHVLRGRVGPPMINVEPDPFDLQRGHMTKAHSLGL